MRNLKQQIPGQCPEEVFLEQGGKKSTSTVIGHWEGKCGT